MTLVCLLIWTAHAESGMRVQVLDKAKPQGATPAATTSPPPVALGEAPAVLGTGATPPPNTPFKIPTQPAPPPPAFPQMPALPGMGGGMPSGYLGESEPPTDFSPETTTPGSTPGGGGPGGYASAMGEEAFLGSHLSCVRNGTEVCRGVDLKLAPFPAQNPHHPDKQKFIDWLRPAALYVQAQTGMPASVIIAQAGIESGWGSSVNFARRNNMFGHSCWDNNMQSGQAQIGPNFYRWKGDCAAFRKKEEGGKYLVFPNLENSLLAYLQNILMSRARYKGAQAEVTRARSGEAPGIGNWQTVLRDIVANGYATSKGYFMAVGSAILNLHLDKLDGGDCQLCVHQKRKEGQPVSGTAESAR